MFFAGAVKIKARILSANTDGIPVYTPQGIANNYTDYLGLSIDTHKVRGYRLSDKEVEAINDELNNGKWQKTSNKDYREIIDRYFTINLDSVTHEAMLENIYYCIYDPTYNTVLTTSEDNASLG